ncbi:MAG TPA: hypothetical protein VK558_15600, partial [Patescibacteria group bacterium]|nr:hypothetical protein [Patescibacteria group bacterium]
GVAPTPATATLTITYPGTGSGGSGGGGSGTNNPPSGTATETTQTAKANNNQQISQPMTTNLGSVSAGLLPPPSGIYATGSNLVGANQTSYSAATYNANFANYTLNSSLASSTMNAYFDFSTATVTSGTACFSSTPGNTGPYIDASQMTVANSSWVWSNVYVNALPNHAIDFMGTNPGTGCTGMNASLQFTIPSVYKGIQAAIYFDPAATQPAAVGFTFKNSGTTHGTIYVCNSASNAQANTLFPTITAWGSVVNWCQSGSGGSTLSTNDPQYLYFYDFSGGFTEVDIFAVGTTKFWLGGVGLMLN